MAKSMSFLLTAVFLLAFSPMLSFSMQYSQGGYLYPQFYSRSCPQLKQIVSYVVEKAVAKDPRMAASLLRLSFHDCFVQGCDASLLLDSSGSIVSEKRSNPNRNSVRGFEVLDEIKSEVEKQCPETVSCADILVLASKESTVLAGGPDWELPLGRRDSLTASLSGSNNNIPAPNSTFLTIFAKFKQQGLDIEDLVALSGSHTIGDARCTSFKQRLYNQNGNGKPDYTLNQGYANELRGRCPRSGGDQSLFLLDYSTPLRFDNSYFKNILSYRGLLNSDEVLLTQSQGASKLVKEYAYDNNAFFQQFAKSMTKLQMISPLTGYNGEIRKNCRRVNSPYHH
ncbi:hypothetical protein V2J09_008480 [Rumex salicifolius]